MFRCSVYGENSTFDPSPHKLVVAEKPSVAREIAKVIGANESVNGALYGNGYIVTNAVGHLVELKEPDDYDERYKNWNLDDLPIAPDFEFKENIEKHDQLANLTALMNSQEVDSIICATDAAREGECIFRYIYEYIGCTKPFERLWISSLTVESIRQGFANLKPSSDYDKVYDAGFARNKVDWIFGMNMSRLYSIYCNGTCRVGRCQTAILNMIVQRDMEIANFVKKPFYKLKLENGAEWFEGEDNSFPDRQQAENIKAKCEHQLCTVRSADTTLKKENRPLLFSLTSLQSEANEKLGMSAAATLVVMQSLYEKQLLTYPRTDSNYITDDMAAEMEERVKMLRFFDEKTADDLILGGLNLDSRVVNNKKVSDHHAIIPTENIVDIDKIELSNDEKNILEMVMRRFLAVFCKEYQYNETEYIFEINGETFKCKSKVPVQLGWRALYADGKDETDGNVNITYKQGETFEAKDLAIVESETQPPKAFTEATLLRAMENIDRRIEDKALSEYVSERGLGTPATRADIIEKIIKYGYVERVKKTLKSTEIGRKIIEMLPEDVKSIEMTAGMEQQLAAVEKGEISADEVVTQMISKVKSVIEAEKTRPHISLASPQPRREPLGKCPKCGGAVYAGKLKNGSVIYYCENSFQEKENPCIFRIFADDLFWTSKKKTLGVKTLQTLLTKGKVKVNGLFSEKKNKTYDAIISFGDDWTDKSGKTRIGFKMEFEDKKKGGK